MKRSRKLHPALEALVAGKQLCESSEQAVAILEELEVSSDELIEELGLKERALRVKAHCTSDNKLLPKLGFFHCAFQVRCWENEVVAENFRTLIEVALPKDHSEADLQFINEALIGSGFTPDGSEMDMILLGDDQRPVAEADIYYFERITKG